jgi:hypothetical protein
MCSFYAQPHYFPAYSELPKAKIKNSRRLCWNLLECVGAHHNLLAEKRKEEGLFGQILVMKVIPFIRNL